MFRIANHSRTSLRNSQKDIACADVPDTNEPVTVRGRKESLADRHTLEVYAIHPPNELKSGEDDDCQRCTIIFQEYADRMVEKIAIADETGNITNS